MLFTDNACMDLCKVLVYNIEVRHETSMMCFHEILNHPNKIYHESQFMVYHGLFHGP